MADIGPTDFPHATRKLIRLHEQHAVVKLALPALDAFALLANLQLALRHPENDGAAAEACRSIVYAIANQLGPELSDLVEAGWHD